jgi:predicted transglutaminase-like cysteine proteinase
MTSRSSSDRSAAGACGAPGTGSASLSGRLRGERRNFRTAALPAAPREPRQGVTRACEHATMRPSPRQARGTTRTKDSHSVGRWCKQFCQRMVHHCGVEWFESLKQPQAAVVAAIIASVGANVVGNVLTWRAQKSQRWDENTRLAYIRTYQAARAVAFAYDADGETVQSDDDVHGLIVAFNDAYAEAILMAKSRRTDIALDNLMEAIGNFSSTKATGPEKHRVFQEATTDFYRCARHDLRLPRHPTVSFDDISRRSQENSALPRPTRGG